MLLKCAKASKAPRCGAKKSDYLTEKSDAEQKMILEGDPKLVGQIVDGLDFSTKYTEAVMKWRPDERQPTRDELQQIVSDYKALAFAGIEDRVAFTAVQHVKEDGSIDVHMWSANVDLETGKNFNPMPPGHEQRLQAIKELALARHPEWLNPEKLQADVGLEHVFESTGQSAAERRNTFKETVARHTREAFESGVVNDRAELVSMLKASGMEIQRINNKGFTIVNPEKPTEKYRMRGALYEHDTTRESILKHDRERLAETTDRSPVVDQQQLERAEQRFESIRSSVEKENQKRYCNSERSVEQEQQRDRDSFDRLHSALAEPAKEHTEEVGLDGLDAGDRSLADHLRDRLGDAAMVPAQHQPEPTVSRGNERDRSSSELEREPVHHNRRQLQARRDIMPEREPMLASRQEEISDGTDSIRERALARVREVINTVRDYSQRFGAAIRHYDRKLQSAGDELSGLKTAAGSRAAQFEGAAGAFKELSDQCRSFAIFADNKVAETQRAEQTRAALELAALESRQAEKAERQQRQEIKQTQSHGMSM